MQRNQVTLTKNQKKTIRAIVPTAVGALVALFVKNGLDLSNDTIVIMLPVITSVYYGAIKAAEKKWPNLSWLLGAFPHDPFKVEKPCDAETKKP